MRKIIISIFLLIATVSCESIPQRTTVLRIKGSDTMLGLAENLAAEYMKKNRNTAIYVEGGGTAEGVAALADGTAHIAAASRKLLPEEAKILADKHGTIGVGFLIAKDALSVYINEENSVRHFTIDQVKSIYTCQFKNWSEFGGDNSSINPFIRMPNSGTYLYFMQHVLGGEKYCEDAKSMSSMASMIKGIQKDKNSIGYGGIGVREKGIVHASINGIEPTEENVLNDKYPIIRYLYLYTLKTPQGELKNFLEWVMSKEGQGVIKSAGYIPIWRITF